MKVVAFMQNMWVRDPVRVRTGIARWGENYRHKIITYSLFAGCLSGRRVKEAFGHDMCRLIHWEEASRTITNHPSEAPPADPAHIAAVLRAEKPDIVICFGRIAADALTQLWSGKIIFAPHPAGRGADVPVRLRDAAIKLRRALH